jgi:hypothetical protein
VLPACGPQMRKTPPLLGAGSSDRRGEDRQLRKRNAQRLLLEGNAGALIVNRFEQQLLVLWIWGHRGFLLNESCFSVSLHGGPSYSVLAENGFYANVWVGHIKGLRSASAFLLTISGVARTCGLQIL